MTLASRELFDAIAGPRKEIRGTRGRACCPSAVRSKSAEALAAYHQELRPASTATRRPSTRPVDFNHEHRRRVFQGDHGDGRQLAVVDRRPDRPAGRRRPGGGLQRGLVRHLHHQSRACARPLEELTEGAQQVVSASSQVATSAQSLSQGATEQAASLEETSASMEEMASMTRQNAENSQTAATLMGEVDARVQRVEPGARRHGDVDGVDPGVEPAGREDHQDDRRDRLPDQHPRAQRRRRSGARRRGRHGLRGGGRRSAQPRAALGAGGARHGGADRRVDREGARAATARWSRWRRAIAGDHRERRPR